MVGGKGGVGKSTIAINLAHALAMDDGSKVLVLDMDPQGTVLRWQADRGEGAPHLFDVKPCQPTQGFTLAELNKLMEGYDHVVIDAPPRSESSTMRWAVVASDVLLVPVRASAADAWGQEPIIRLVVEAKARGAVPPGQKVAFVKSQRDSRWMGLRDNFDADWFRPYGLPILHGTGHLSGYAYAITRCETVFEDDRRGKPAAEIMQLLSDLKGL